MYTPQQCVVVCYRPKPHISPEILIVIKADRNRVISSILDQYAKEYDFDRETLIGMWVEDIALEAASPPPSEDAMKTNDRTVCTEREKEIQELAIKAVWKIIPTCESNIKLLSSSMELCYYLKQFTTRLEIMMSMKFGLNDGADGASPRGE